MRRESTSKIRQVLDDVMPAAMRDSRIYQNLATLAWGDHVAGLAGAGSSRSRDMSTFCRERIVADVRGTSVCDIGCGDGRLLSQIRQARPAVTRLTGVNPAANTVSWPWIDYATGDGHALPFADGQFDTLICTYGLEQATDCQAMIAEWRRVARRRIIIVAERKSEPKKAAGAKRNYFPYTQSLVRALQPVPVEYDCDEFGQDLYYCEARPL
jgi:SAM-dependent methyltransferase